MASMRVKADGEDEGESGCFWCKRWGGSAEEGECQRPKRTSANGRRWRVPTATSGSKAIGA
eukprot:1927235-Pleurochrysis_carterae.AAC.2